MEFYRPTMLDLLEAIKDYGDRVSPRGFPTRELIGVSLRWPLGMYPIPGNFPSRLAAACGVSLIAGQYSLDLFQQAKPDTDPSLFDQWARYSLSVARQVPHAVHLLKKEPSTRRAIVYFGKAADVGGDNTTRITSLHWLIRDGCLHAILSQRSSDLAWGFSLDIVAVTALTLAVAQYLSVLPGRMVMHVGSLHTYDSTTHLVMPTGNHLGRVEVKLADPGSYRGWNGVQMEAREHMNATAWDWVKVS